MSLQFFTRKIISERAYYKATVELSSKLIERIAGNLNQLSPRNLKILTSVHIDGQMNIANVFFKRSAYAKDMKAAYMYVLRFFDSVENRKVAIPSFDIVINLGNIFNKYFPNDKLVKKIGTHAYEVKKSLSFKDMFQYITRLFYMPGFKSFIAHEFHHFYALKSHQFIETNRIKIGIAEKEYTKFQLKEYEYYNRNEEVDSRIVQIVYFLPEDTIKNGTPFARDLYLRMLSQPTAFAFVNAIIHKFIENDSWGYMNESNRRKVIRESTKAYSEFRMKFIDKIGTLDHQ